MKLSRFFISATTFLISLTVFFPQYLYGRDNQRRGLQAIRVDRAPRIDGSQQDPIWQKAVAATDFFQYEPHNDRPASQQTKVRVLYDDHSIYIGAMLFDPAPDSILTQLGLRDSDDKLNADQFWVDINPFNDGINGFRFKVSASGVQSDLNMSGVSGGNGGSNRGDLNWDAVWISAVSITQQGWIVEMQIPYSALRFPRNEVHEWGINFWREVRRSRESSSWNFVNRRLGNPMASMGVLTGIDNVTPPLRLSFFPYLSSYTQKDGLGQQWSNSVNGGMDVKYGISQNFTLDMTLVPDFGQVQSDAQVLNLSPYEVKFDENRQFFTEGTELYNKADLFYSRRIGARPRGYSLTGETKTPQEQIVMSPVETRMVNATKFSGRLASGLGIGVFNAMTAASHSTLLDTVSGQFREITTQPFTNYNLVVLDQSLRNNSFISLINTNVTGAEKGYSANVSGTEFRLLNRSNMFRISGTAALSQQYFSQDDNNYGFKYQLAIGKFGGTWQYHYARSVITDTYDQSDMGFLKRNNLITDGLSLSYNIFDPFWKLLNLTNSLSLEQSRLYNPNTFTGMSLGYSLRALFHTRFFVMFRANYQPMGNRDYFEPRVAGRFYKTPEAMDLHLMYSSDYRKRIYVDGNLRYDRVGWNLGQESFSIDFKPTFRASDRFNLVYGIIYEEKHNDFGYVGHTHADSIYFGRRFSPTLINTIGSSYIFSRTLSLGFNLRHYWSQVEYQGDYYLLAANGSLLAIDNDLNVSNINYNAFTIDMLLTWNFAPGSQLTAAWKNVIDSRGSHLYHGYFDNLSRILQQPQINSFSVKLLYYLDYPMIQRITRK